MEHPSCRQTGMDARLLHYDSIDGSLYSSDERHRLVPSALLSHHRHMSSGRNMDVGVASDVAKVWRGPL